MELVKNCCIFSGSQAERLTLYRAVRNSEMAKRFYSLPSNAREDVEFHLMDIQRVNIGEPFRVVINIQNRSEEERTIQAILSAGSVYYTGVKANLVKKASGKFVLQPNASKCRHYKISQNQTKNNNNKTKNQATIKYR